MAKKKWPVCGRFVVLGEKLVAFLYSAQKKMGGFLANILVAFLVEKIVASLSAFLAVFLVGKLGGFTQKILIILGGSTHNKQ